MDNSPASGLALEKQQLEDEKHLSLRPLIPKQNEQTGNLWGTVSITGQKNPILP